MKLVECVPNFSEGRNRNVIDAVVDAAAGVDGVKVLDVDPGTDTNRTVLTFVAEPDAAVEGAFAVVRKAAELIDMSRQYGAHARHGATDVCPFVPVSGVTMDDCAELARRLGERVGEELGIPIYLYEHAASRPEWRNLAVVRKGEYEALPKKLTAPEWKPDYGPAEWNERVKRSGVVTVGAREFLIAYNINLNTRDKRYAKDIALEIREAGRAKRTGNTDPDYFRGERLRYQPSGDRWPCGICDHIAGTLEEIRTHFSAAHRTTFDEHLSRYGQKLESLEGKIVKKPGLFDHCKATGWVIEEYGCAQVTMNLTNYHVSPPHLVLEAVRDLARQRGITVTGSEIVGVVPFQAMIEAGRYYQSRYGGSTALPWRDLIEIAVRSMNLADVAPFEIDKKVLGLPEAPGGCLMALPCREFVDEVSRESPAPGGGSVAALVGALGGGLAAMVGNLAIDKVGYEEQSPRLNELALRAQIVKDRLGRSVDTDTEAFNFVLDAMRLPRGNRKEKEARAVAIQQGYQRASRVPLETAKSCLEVIDLAIEIGELGNPASLSDAGVAVLTACAGVEGAAYNVRINLPTIDDPAFRQELSTELDEIVATAKQRRDEFDQLVLKKLSA
ncbi:MAG: glutamate formimidoyltransferase [Gemmatimonadetes bacterium]|nr:glutamate formimidoyltransferase [Gemmatimonadota bacterium]